jgi:hypothetical protein
LSLGVAIAFVLVDKRVFVTEIAGAMEYYFRYVQIAPDFA